MSTFAKIMSALAVVLVISVVLFFASLITLIGGMSKHGAGYKEPRAHITELRIEGPIMGSEAYLESIQRISEDKACKGILLRIDSPGGAVGSSQEIQTALVALKKKNKLPIVVSQGNLAASGGYYVSLAGDKIFSNPGTLTGSIGVILQFPEAQKLMEKIGVKMNTIKSGALKDVGNFARSPTPEELKYLQSVIDNTYGQFVDDIVASRKVDKAALLKIADGRVLTGSQAKEHGLVDTLGGYQEARHYLAGLAKLEGEPVVVREPPAKSWIENAVSSQSEASSLGALAETAREWLPAVRQGTYFLWK
jgi:protease-4